MQSPIYYCSVSISSKLNANNVAIKTINLKSDIRVFIDNIMLKFQYTWNKNITNISINQYQKSVICIYSTQNSSQMCHQNKITKNIIDYTSQNQLMLLAMFSFILTLFKQFSFHVMFQKYQYSSEPSEFNTSQNIYLIQFSKFKNCVMIKSVLLNRLSDALPFCQTNEVSTYNNQAIQTIKSKVKKYHKEITAASKSMDAHIKQIQNTSFGIFYKVQDYVIFTIIVENGYPTKLIASFLDSISAAFFDEAKCVLGTQNLRSRLQSIEGSHYFVKFDRIIKQKKKQYDDPTSLKNTERLKKELENIQDIMKENMNFLDKRHNDLLETEAKAKKLSEQSKIFSSTSKKLVWQLWLKKNMVWIAVICIILFLYFLF